jgi:hypothetical protein
MIYAEATMLPTGLRFLLALRKAAVLAAVVGIIILLVVSAPPVKPAAAQFTPTSPAAPNWVVLAWNDLGMHCYNRDFQDLAVLPPYNNLWAQVVKVGDPPQIVTNNVDVAYSFPDNTYSTGKSNFWDYDFALFGVDLAPNVGLTGKGLAGQMDKAADHFTAEGIPLTEYRDSAPTVPYPYQLATVIARDLGAGSELARTTTVAPVSTEMHCDYCHSDGQREGIATGKVETNILVLHDKENAEEYPPGFGKLMDNRPVLCASCHASNALGTPGKPGIPNLSKAVHAKHAGVENEDDDRSGAVGKAALADNFCYNCHPGPATQCLRDVMASRGMTCTDCHGSMDMVAANPSPWLNEPRCDSCHTDPNYKQDQPLYRMSTGHGGIRCAGCHDSPHAIAESSQPNDAIKFIAWQGHAGTLDTCTVCHATEPTEPGPHGLLSAAGASHHLYLPEMRSSQ